MEAKFYLVIKSRERYMNAPLYMNAAPRCTKKKPDIGADEVALKFNIEIPDSFFRRPLLTINTKITDSSKGDHEIIAELQQEIETRLKDIQGVSVSIASPEAES